MTILLIHKKTTHNKTALLKILFINSPKFSAITNLFSNNSATVFNPIPKKTPKSIFFPQRNIQRSQITLLRTPMRFH